MHHKDRLTVTGMRLVITYVSPLEIYMIYLICTGTVLSGRRKCARGVEERERICTRDGIYVLHNICTVQEKELEDEFTGSSSHVKDFKCGYFLYQLRKSNPGSSFINSKYHQSSLPNSK